MEEKGQNEYRFNRETLGECKWHSGRGIEALRKMSKEKLVEYANLLETTLLRIHRHYYYTDFHTSVTDDGEYQLRCNREDFGWDGQWLDIGLSTLFACLKMYRVHSAEFMKVGDPRRKQIGGNSDAQ